MKVFRYGAALILLLSASLPARAGIGVACGGYDPVLNDHVEWSLTIYGTEAEFNGKHFQVSETRKFFVLVGPDSQIQINKLTKRYVIYGPKGKAAPAIGWSRNTPSEGCDFSN